MQGNLARKKQRPPTTLQQEYAQGPMVVLGGGAVSSERGTPVGASAQTASSPVPAQGRGSAVKATQGQMHGFLSQPPYKCHLEEVDCGSLT